MTLEFLLLALVVSIGAMVFCGAMLALQRAEELLRGWQTGRVLRQRLVLGHSRPPSTPLERKGAAR